MTFWIRHGKYYIIILLLYYMYLHEHRSETPAGSVDNEGSEALSASELRHRKELEYEEDEGQEEAVVELKHAVLELPNLPMPRSSDGVVCHLIQDALKIMID